MPATRQELIEASLEGALAVLVAASAELAGADWAAHDQAVNAIMDSTTAFYLRTAPTTGQLMPAVIWPEFGEVKSYNFGCFALLVRPLVDQLAGVIDDIENGDRVFDPPEQDLIDLANLKARIDLYYAALDSASPVVPDPIVWERVTAPLLLGYYPADFVDAGIVNPAVKSPPDLVKPYTLGFQAALAGALRRERWDLLISDLGSNVRGVIEAVIGLPGKIQDAVKKRSGWLAAGLVLGGGAAVYLFGKKRR